MTVQARRHQAAALRAKKPRNAESQTRLRKRTAGSGFAKLHQDSSVLNTILESMNANGKMDDRVELADDVIIIGRDGRRVIPSGNAALRIDQLPQFSKK